MNKQKLKQSAFTLIELIVVITILSILWIISFISLQWYSAQSRDSVRLSNILNLHKWLELHKVNSWNYPLPDEYVEITSSWEIIWYQWYAKESIERIARITKLSTQDPLNTNIYTTYATNINRNKLQLMVFLESAQNIVWYSTIIEKSIADFWIDYSKRTSFTRWDEIWVILWNTWVNLNQPIQETWTWIDVSNTQTEYKVYFNEESSLIWTWSDLKTMKPIMYAWRIAKSCKEYLDIYPRFKWEDWKYLISPTLNDKFEVYCDMTNNWWWWTIIASDGLLTNTQSLINTLDTPTKEQTWLLKYFIKSDLKSFWKILKVTSINDPSKSIDFDITQSWLWDNFRLWYLEYGYSYSSSKWISWWINSPHKCNFSIIVIWTWWCTTALNLTYPANWLTLWGWTYGPTPNYWSVKYSWQFIWNWNLYRLWWVQPTWYEGYYNSRLASYLMIQ